MPKAVPDPQGIPARSKRNHPPRTGDGRHSARLAIAFRGEWLPIIESRLTQAVFPFPIF